MKSKIIIALLVFLFLCLGAYAQDKNDFVTVESFANTMIEKLGLQANVTEGMSFEQINSVLPEPISTQLAQLKSSDFITRQVLAGVLAPYLAPEEVEGVLTKGNVDQPLESWEIFAVLDKCAYEGGVLTFIRPPKYAFSDLLETRLADIDEVPVSGE